MIIQTAISSSLLPLIIVLLGIIFIIFGAYLLSRNQQGQERMKTESKGIILLGPIPIVWGFSRRVKILIGAVALVSFVLMLLLWVY